MLPGIEALPVGGEASLPVGTPVIWHYHGRYTCQDADGKWVAIEGSAYGDGSEHFLCRVRGPHQHLQYGCATIGAPGYVLLTISSVVPESRKVVYRVPLAEIEFGPEVTARHVALNMGVGHWAW